MGIGYHVLYHLPPPPIKICELRIFSVIIKFVEAWLCNVYPVMASYDNKHWLSSHIRNSFIVSDDTGNIYSD